MNDGIADFRIATRAAADGKSAVGGFSFVDHTSNGDETYHGVIRDFQYTTTGAELTGGGGLTDGTNPKERVKFVLDVTPGGVGVGQLNLTFTSKDGSTDHYTGSLTDGTIVIGPAAVSTTA